MGVKKQKARGVWKMKKVIKVLEDIKTRVAQVDPELGRKINDSVLDLEMNDDPAMPVSEMKPSMNPQIESFAKPSQKMTITDDSGTVHSFAVEIKAKHNGPIPDTQLMSKILQAVESHSDSTKDFAAGDTPDENSFEVVSFKYERRDDKKKQ